MEASFSRQIEGIFFNGVYLITAPVVLYPKEGRKRGKNYSQILPEIEPLVGAGRRALKFIVLVYHISIFNV